MCEAEVIACSHLGISSPCTQQRKSLAAHQDSSPPLWQPTLRSCSEFYKTIAHTCEINKLLTCQWIVSATLFWHSVVMGKWGFFEPLEPNVLKICLFLQALITVTSPGEVQGCSEIRQASWWTGCFLKSIRTHASLGSVVEATLLL